MAEKQKDLNFYKATWNKVKADPRKWLDNHVKFQCTAKPPPPAEGVYDVATTVRDGNNYRTFNQTVDEWYRQIAKICLQKFIEVEQRLPKKDEKMKCTICQNVELIERKKKSCTFALVGRILPKV